MSKRFWIENHVFDALALPGIGDVDESVAGLNDCRIRIFTWLIFEDYHRLPMNTITGKRHIQRRALSSAVVVHQQSASILQRDRIDSTVRIGKSAGSHRRPGFAAVSGPALGDLLLPAPAEYLHSSLAMGDYSRLDRGELFAVVERLGFRPGHAEIRSALKMDLPARVFGAGRAE